MYEQTPRIPIAKSNMSLFYYYCAIIENFLYEFSVTKSLIETLDRLNAIIKYVKNWYEVVLFRLGVFNRITVKFRDGIVYSANSVKDWRRCFSEHLQKSYTQILERHGLNVYAPYFYEKDETFISEPYRLLGVKNRVVLDVGAFIGDTAIYFALKGAKHVYGYEPYPSHYRLARKYIEEAGLSNKITLFNEGVNCRRHEVVLPEEDAPIGARDLSSHISNRGVTVKITTLDEIVNQLKMEHAVLKIDCEGCEYSVILMSTDAAIRRFDEIIMEYHYGYKNLAEKLRKVGFTVRHTRPKRSHNPYAKHPQMFLGYLYAKQVGA